MVDNAYAVIMGKVGARLQPKGAAPAGMVNTPNGLQQEGEFLLAMPPHATGRLIGTGGASIKRIKETAPNVRMRVDNDMCFMDSEDKVQLEQCFNTCCAELDGHDYTIVRGPGGKSNVVVDPGPKGGKKGKGKEKGQGQGEGMGMPPMDQGKGYDPYGQPQGKGPDPYGQPSFAPPPYNGGKDDGKGYGPPPGYDDGKGKG